MKINTCFVFWFLLLCLLLYWQIGWLGVLVAIWTTVLGKIWIQVWFFLSSIYDVLKNRKASKDVRLIEWLSIPFLLILFLFLYLLLVSQGVKL
jgi:hypothetical protein